MNCQNQPGLALNARTASFKFFLILILAATLITLAHSTLVSRADTGPAPAFVIVDGDYDALQDVRRQIEHVGGRVGHVFPPDALIARLTSAQASILRDGVAIKTLTFAPLKTGLLTGSGPQPAVRIWNTAFHGTPSETTSPPLLTDEIITRPLPPEADTPQAGATPAPGFYDTSEFMIGDIVVAMVLPESNGVAEPSTEDWTESEVTTVQSMAVTSLDLWVQAEPNADITFIYVWADAPPSGGVDYTVECDYEAMNHSNLSGPVINSYMATLGYHNPGYATNILTYLNDLRDQYDADWAFLPEIRDTSTLKRGGASLGGPSFTLYDTDFGGAYAMAHETGHIFYAQDEYCPDQCIEPTVLSGYHQSVNANSAGPGGSGGPGYFNGNGEAVLGIMISSPSEVNPYTRGQIGWRDTDGDGVLDVRDTFPDTTLVTPTLGATLFISGTATVVPLPGHGSTTFSINALTNVEVQINGLTWLPAIPVDGAFDDPVESFSLDLPLLPDGTYTIRARGQNDVGNVERSPAYTSITIAGSPTTNTPPFAAFDLLPAQNGDPASFTADASASADLQGQPIQVRWDWEDDGSWDTSWSSTLSALHTFAPPGDTVVALQVQDSLGATAHVTRELTVPGGNTPPLADFIVIDGDRRFGTPTPSFTFDARHSSDAETPLSGIEFRWDFDGDGTWDTGWDTVANQVVSTTFTLTDRGKPDHILRSNHWNTTLEVRDGDGATAQATRHVWANPYNTAPEIAGAGLPTVVHTDLPPFAELDTLVTDPDRDTTWDGLLLYRVDWQSDGNWDSQFAFADTWWADYTVAEPGTYTITLQVRDRFEALDTISYTLAVLDPPAVVLDDEWQVTCPAGEVVQRDLVVANSGGYSLTLELAEMPLNANWAYTFTDSTDGSIEYDRVTYWPIPHAEAGDWVSTTVTHDADDEGYVGPIDLGFSFPYHGHFYDQVYIAANGYLSFSPPPADFGPGTIPSGDPPNGMLAPFWTDLDLATIAPGTGSLSFISLLDEERFVADYWNVSGSSGAVGRFQVVLSPDGTILYQYANTANTAAVLTGIESPDGTYGLTYTRSLTNDLAIAFTPTGGDIPWLTFATIAGMVAGSDQLSISATLDATGLAQGSYTALVYIRTNDPDAPVVMLPVTLHVYSERVFLPMVVRVE